MCAYGRKVHFPDRDDLVALRREMRGEMAVLRRKVLMDEKITAHRDGKKNYQNVLQLLHIRNARKKCCQFRDEAFKMLATGQE